MKSTTQGTNDYHRKMTVSEFAWKWVARKQPELKPSTRHRYGDQVRLICDGLGDINISELSPGTVTKWLASLALRKAPRRPS